MLLITSSLKQNKEALRIGEWKQAVIKHKKEPAIKAH
jgi:hypothetical protein